MLKRFRPVWCVLLLALATPAFGQVALRPATGGLAAARATARAIALSEPGAAKVTLVRVDGAILKAAAPNGNLEFKLSATQSVFFRTHDVQPLEGNRFVWSGDADGALQLGTATIVVDGSDVTGSLTTPEGTRYQLRPAGGGSTALIEIDPRKLPPEDPLAIPGGEAPPPHRQEGSLQSGKTSVIDILVAYTPAAESASRGIDNLIALAVSQSNRAFANSNVDVQFHLAAAMRIDYNEAGKDYLKILDDLVARADVRDRRNSSNADVVVLLVDNHQACGRAERIGAPADQAYVAVDQGCADGYTFAHEIGHLAGARHDTAHDTTTTPYAYGHGFVGGRWRTIMAYDCDRGGCSTRIAYWSSPKTTYTDGKKMGTEDREDAARVWRERAPEMADFRDPLPWETMGGLPATSNPSCVKLGPERIACFVSAADKLLQQFNWTGQGKNSSEVWFALKDQVRSAPDCLTMKAGRIDCFFANDKSALVDSWRWTPGSASSQVLGDGIAGPASCVSAKGGEMDCFVRRRDDTVGHIAYRGDRWGAWENLTDKVDSALSCVANGLHVIDCFAHAKSGGLWQGYWNGANLAGRDNHGGGFIGRPECVSWGSGRMDCFVEGDTDEALYHIAADAGGWHGWENKGGAKLDSDIGCASRMTGRLDCYALRKDDPGLHHRGWNGSDWTGWDNVFGRPSNTPECLSAAQDSVDCFVRNNEGQIMHRRLKF
ncbi:MAG TPA: M12 family metallo-peptidase [Rhizomicrobium sp.]|nr:M12 family metallo-peptidase [Rhizomicrobium sp.]